MIEVTVLYPRTPGSHFDEDYYLGTHMPWSIELLGPAMDSITVRRCVEPGAPWPAPAYWAVCTFACASREVFEAAFFPHMEALQADAVNYTDVEQHVVVTEHALTWPGPA